MEMTRGHALPVLILLTYLGIILFGKSIPTILLNNMKQDSFKGDNFIVHLNSGRSSDANHPYEMVLASKYVWPSMSKKELKGLADFIYEAIGEKK
jgi:hypothetical protein